MVHRVYFEFQSIEYFGGHNFQRTKVFGGQNFGQQARFPALLSPENFPDKVQGLNDRSFFPGYISSKNVNLSVEKLPTP